MTCDFQQCVILTSVDSDEPCSLPLRLEAKMVLNSHGIFKGLAKALLVAHTTFLKISCPCSYYVYVFCLNLVDIFEFCIVISV